MAEQAVALNPNLAIAWYSRGWVSLMCGEAERSIESFDRMIRLSPLDGLRVSAWNGSSFALYQLHRYEEGCAVAMKSIQVVRDAYTLGAWLMPFAVARLLKPKKRLRKCSNYSPDSAFLMHERLFRSVFPTSANE